MGFNLSKQVVENATNIGISNTTITNAINVCKTESDNLNEIVFDGSTVSGLTVEQKNLVSGYCTLKNLLKIENKNEIEIDRMVDLISKQVKDGFLNLGSNLDVKEIKNKITADYDTRTVINKANKVLNSVNSTNRIKILSSNVSKTTIRQANETILKAFIVDELGLDNFYKSNVKDDITAKTTQKIDTSFFTGSLSILLVILIVGGVIYIRNKNKKN